MFSRKSLLKSYLLFSLLFAVGAFGKIETTLANDRDGSAEGLAHIRLQHAWQVPIDPETVERNRCPVVNEADWPAAKKLCEKAIQEESLAIKNLENGILQTKGFREAQDLTRNFIEDSRNRETKFFDGIVELVDPLQCEMLLESGGTRGPYWFFSKFHHYCFNIDKKVSEKLLTTQASRLDADFSKLAELAGGKNDSQETKFYFAMRQLEMVSLFFRNTDRTIHRRIVSLLMPEFAGASGGLLIEEGKRSLKRVYEDPKFHDEIDKKVNLAISSIDLNGASKQ